MSKTLYTIESRKKRRGLTWSEFLVMLSVTLVLAAILMPAIASTNPKRAEDIMEAATVPAVLEGISRTNIGESPDTRVSSETRQRFREASRTANAEHGDADGETASAAPERPAIANLLTTDIRYRQPF